MKNVPSFNNAIKESVFKKLHEIQKQHSTYVTIPPKYQNGEVYRKFIDALKKRENVFEIFTLRDIKILPWEFCHYEEKRPYNIKIIEDYRLTKIALQLIESKFRPSMIIPLLYCYLSSWSLQNEILKEFLRIHLKKYSGKNRLLLKIKEYAKFFLDNRGTILFASYLYENNIPPYKIWEILELPEYSKAFEYFSELAVQYTQLLLSKNFSPDELSNIVEFLKAHNNHITDKKVFSKIIIRLGSNADEMYKERIQQDILQRIGDPSDESKWLPWKGATEAQKRMLKKAREIFNEWYTKESIEFFFDRISRTLDPEDFNYRKSFWLAYAKYINYFRIASDNLLLNTIKKDSKAYQLFSNRFAYLDGAERDQCAFLFRIKNKIFVEFAKKGAALYIYDAENSNAPSLYKDIYSMSELRQPGNRHSLMKSDGYYILCNEEGRFFHKESECYKWQDRLKDWIEEVLGILPSSNYKI